MHVLASGTGIRTSCLLVPRRLPTHRDAHVTDWLLVDLACQAYNKVTVALYDTLGADSVGTHIIPHAGALTANPFCRICVRI